MSDATTGAAVTAVPLEAWMDFAPSDWFWIVSGDRSRLWSSARGRYVAPDDGGYRDWLDHGGQPTMTANEFELDQVLRQHGLSLGRGFSTDETLSALRAIDAKKLAAVLGRDATETAEDGDGEKLLAAAELLAGAPRRSADGIAIGGVTKPSVDAAIEALETRVTALEQRG